MLDEVSSAFIAMVRMMKKIGDAIQGDPKACALRRFNLRAQMVEQGFHFSPMNVGGMGVLEYGTQKVVMFMAHDDDPVDPQVAISNLQTV